MWIPWQSSGWDSVLSLWRAWVQSLFRVLGSHKLHCTAKTEKKKKFSKWQQMKASVDSKEKAMAPHSSTLAWKIPWTEEPGGLQSMGSLKSQTLLSDFTFTFHFHALEKEMATHSSVLAWRLPGMGEPGGLPSMGSHRVGHDWSDLATAAAGFLQMGIQRHSWHLGLASVGVCPSSDHPSSG